MVIKDKRDNAGHTVCISFLLQFWALHKRFEIQKDVYILNKERAVYGSGPLIRSFKAPAYHVRITYQNIHSF